MHDINRARKGSSKGTPMSNVYEAMTDAELDEAIRQLEEQADQIRARGLKLDMARGKPSVEQTDLSRPMLDLLSSTASLTDDGAPADNYGIPDGLPSARKLAASLLGVDVANVIVNGSSSLNLMHDVVVNAYTKGIAGCDPWCRQGTVKFLCPSPGYDRHFAVTARYGIENVPIAMLSDGPNMDEVERLVETDASVKGIWCVPKYANPTGITYSDEVVRRFASLKPAARDFRIFWDNAYVVHDLYDEGDKLLNIFDAIAEAGTANLVYDLPDNEYSRFDSLSENVSYLKSTVEGWANVQTAIGNLTAEERQILQAACTEKPN